MLAASLLLIGCLMTLCAALVLCYCVEKWTKVQQERRRRRDFGDYERIDSVSSFVSSVAPPDAADEQMESVSMI